MANILEIKNNLARSINNRENIKNIIEQYKLFIDGVLERDIPEIDKSLRNRISLFYLEFIQKMHEKGYINRENIYNYMERIIKATSNFSNGTGAPDSYAEFTGEGMRFAFSSPFAINNMKHLLFHELVHASIFDESFGGRKFSCGTYKEKERTGTSMRVIKVENFVEPIIDTYMKTRFVEEIIAEATACDLLDDYISPKSIVFPGIADIKSDWITTYNRAYQQLGYEFFKTVYPYSAKQNDRELFKALTLKSLNFNEDVGKEILDSYMRKNPTTWKDDLHEITTILGELSTNHFITIAKVNRVRFLMEKYSVVAEKRTETPQNEEKPRFTVKEITQPRKKEFTVKKTTPPTNGHSR